LVEHVDAESSSSVLDLEVSSMDSDDISNSVDDWEVLELVTDNNDLSVFVFGVDSWVNNLKDAAESVVLNLIWESGIDDDTVEVAWLGGGKWHLIESEVVVL
jgi:hypothetical protein